MKKARIVRLLFFICIILSFFNVASAYTTQGGLAMEIDDEGLQSVDPQNDSVTIISEADYDKQQQSVTFKAGTGLYTIDVEGYSNYTGQDLCFVLTNSKGQEIRLAASYDDTEGNYLTVTDFSNSQKNSTSIDVLLLAGETYTLTLSSSKGTKSSSTPLVTKNNTKEEFKVTIKANKLGAAIDVYQSEYSSRNRSEGTTTGNMEPLVDGTPLDNNGEHLPVKYRNAGFGQTVKDFFSESFQKLINLAKNYLLNPLEETISELLLSFGDFLVSLLNSLVGEEITITSLVFNQVDAVNPNFFDSSLNGKGATAPLKEAISTWYSFFRMVALTIYIGVLLAIGVHVLFSSTGNGMAKAKELLMEWMKGIVYLFFVPYLIKYALLINEGIVGMLAEVSSVPEYRVGTVFGDPDEWSAQEIEYRSPEYVSKYTGAIAYGSDESSKMYINKLNNYEQNFDLMRIMRAYAGVTKKLIYVIIWYILIGQLIAFLVMYYKRYFMIAFFIAAFPIVSIFNAISIARGKAGKEISTWTTEIISNIFTQTIHAILYAVITGVVISVVREDMQSSATLNWILIIIAINFIPQGEKIIKKIFKAISGGSTSGNVSDASKGIKGTFKRAREGASKTIGAFRR